MKVKIDKSVFASAQDDRQQLELSFLLHIILYKGRYELTFTGENVQDYESFSKLNKRDRDVIEEFITHDIVTSATAFDCEVKIGGENEYTKKVFSPSESIRYLLQPTSVILENGLNDAHFMNALFRCFDTTGTLSAYLHEGWMRYENAGGCSNVKNFLNALVQYHDGKQKFLRCFVLLDSDRRYPTDLKVNDKNSTLEQLQAWNVEYHVLEKSCMENYIPTEALRSLSNDKTKEWLDAYFTLTPQQKDYFCLADGFSKDITWSDRKKVKAKELLLTTKDKKLRKKSYVRSFLPKEVQNFYANVSNGNFLHLEKGLDISHFKTKFPEVFENFVLVFKNNLIERTSHQTDPQELEHIVQKIISQL